MRLIGDGVIDVGPDPDVARLEAEVRRLERAVSDADRRAERAREDADRALSALRGQLGPLYRALQAVFGELDAAGVQETAQQAVPVPQKNAGVWDAWKSRLSPASGKVIDALLQHSELNQAQIKVAARLGTSTVSDCITKMNKLGLLNKNGGRFSLKALP